MSRFAPGLVVKMLKLAAFRYCKPECCTAVPLALHRCSELHPGILLQQLTCEGKFEDELLSRLFSGGGFGCELGLGSWLVQVRLQVNTYLASSGEYAIKGKLQ